MATYSIVERRWKTMLGDAGRMNYDRACAQIATMQAEARGLESKVLRVVAHMTELRCNNEARTTRIVARTACSNMCRVWGR